MARQFIIVNNGMTEIRGHYFETALSIAEAARDAGFQPFLAVHETCSVGAMPAWLACLAHFRVDHWGGSVNFGPLQREGIRGDRAAMLDAPIGEVSLARYLMARYEPLPETPPFKRRVKTFVNRWIPAGVRCWLKRAAGMKPEPPAPEPVDPQRHHELECARLFGEDLEYLLCLRDVGSDDLVFMPTANHREVLAVRRLISKIGERRSPRFHLEFRHEIAERGDLANEKRPSIIRETTLARFFLNECKSLPATTRMAFWTDTEELADDYRHLSSEPFGVLPIPFNHSLIANHPEPGQLPLPCLYLGDVREEKGFPLLPKLIHELTGVARPTVVRFVIQTTQPHAAAITPSLLEAIHALESLESLNPNRVELVGRELSFLPREQYFRLLGESAIVLCLYDAKIYRARSSGIMTEALAAGKPVVVPAGTWMSRQLPSGCGESFTDLPSLVEAVRKIASDYGHYHANVQTQRAAWLARHSPRALLKCLVDDGAREKAAA